MAPGLSLAGFQLVVDSAPSSLPNPALFLDGIRRRLPAGMMMNVVIGGVAGAISIAGGG
jgi:hypothetical protein